jgi:hypothetical protein
LLTAEYPAQRERERERDRDLLWLAVWRALERATVVRFGSPLRLVCAIFLSSPVLIEFAIWREAPLSELLGRIPRLADSAAPAAICCFLDLAGMAQPSAGFSNWQVVKCEEHVRRFAQTTLLKLTVNYPSRYFE